LFSVSFLGGGCGASILVSPPPFPRILNSSLESRPEERNSKLFIFYCRRK
jgi:hypothetical protein